MIGEVDALLDVVGQSTNVSARHAIYVDATVEGSAVVQMADSRFSAEFGAGYVPQQGERVLILTIGERHLLFPARPLPGTGTVLTVGESTVSVQTTTGIYSFPYVGVAPTSGDLVGISWSETPYVVGKLSTSPPPPEPIPDIPSKKTRSATFMVTDTGTHNVGSSNYWQSEVWASDTTLGGWFYGTQIADTIPAGAEFVSLEFYVSWQSRRGSTPNFGLHPLTAKSGQLSFTHVQPWAPGSGWQTPPDAAGWFNALKSGGGRRGVGLNHGGFNRFSSRAEDGMTGALRISWRS